MISGGLRCFPRLPAVALVVALSAAGSLLVAQVVERRSDNSTTEQPTTTSAATTSQPASAESVDPAAREHLISGLIGSKHDFTREGESGRDLCLPCHTPHVLTAPMPGCDCRATTTQPLRPYQGRDVKLTGWSLLCLGCHDGIAAPDVYSSAHAFTITDQLASSRLGTTALRSHPVGIKYPLASEDYHSRAAVEAGGLLLPDGRVQCTTCHDAHNTHRYPGRLKISNERSRMCLTCHRR